ncbi:B3 domain-containing protein Os05g0481400 [Euphorbia peplus]|nr:B3 domain-containing protein Os05g0481400 [Euphorbia peplus]
MVADNVTSNIYEEARKQRINQNTKRFEDLGITQSLSKLSTPEKKATQRLLKSKAANSGVDKPRRSSRARKISDTDDVDINLLPMRKKPRFSSSSSVRYVERPSSEFKVATLEERNRVLTVAQEFQTNLKSGKPSFVKSMLKSHVYKGFWLGLDSAFYKDHLPKNDLHMILEDENGKTYNVKYLGDKNGLSGGWRGFALAHKLDDGDAVVFELVNSNKFKLYIFRVSPLASSPTRVEVAEGDGSIKAISTSKDQNNSKCSSSKKQNSKNVKANKVADNETSKLLGKFASEVTGGKDESIVNMEVVSLKENVKHKKNVAKQNPKNVKENVSNVETSKPRNEPATEVISNDTKPVEENVVTEETYRRKKPVAINSGIIRQFKPRKKPAERFLRRRV